MTTTSKDVEAARVEEARVEQERALVANLAEALADLTAGLERVRGKVARIPASRTLQLAPIQDALDRLDAASNALSAALTP